MVARQMVVRCPKCGRRFIRSIGGMRLATHEVPLCWKCESKQWRLNHPNAFTLGDVLKAATNKIRNRG